MSRPDRRGYLIRYDDGSKRPFSRQPEVRIIAENGKLTKVFYEAAIGNKWHKEPRITPMTRYVPSAHISQARARETRKR